MKATVTGRGFSLVTFTDRNRHDCSIQESSAMSDDDHGCLWLGIDDAQPEIMARDAQSIGLKTRETTGWIPYPVPAEVLMHTRMHLDKPRVEQLVEVLTHWLKTARLPESLPEGEE
jgi:hypothetical protein